MLFRILQIITKVLAVVLETELSGALSAGPKKQVHAAAVVAEALQADAELVGSISENPLELIELIKALIDAIVGLLNFLGVFKHAT